MRFDDRIATVLAQPEPNGAALIAKWRQLVDLLAQRPEGASSPETVEALSFLRDHRDDIPAEVRANIAVAIGGSSNSDLQSLFEESAEPRPLNPAAERGELHIRDLVARIETLRRDREGGAALGEPPKSFRWETGSDGVILWVEGVPRGAFIGQSIASPASPGGYGVDGHAAGAWRKRTPFRDARLGVAGQAPEAGDWRISGVPFFDPRLGSFLGYRGSARRPRADEVAAIPLAPVPAAGLFGTELAPDSLRQLIHELRTPLNAIVGFSEMIDGEFLGPANASYRSRAGAIREQAARLLSAVDDLDTAARIETHRFPVIESAVDVEALLSRLQGDYSRVASQRGSALRLEYAADLPLARVEPESAERMFSRLLAATIGLAREGEALSARVTLEGERETICLSIARPDAIAGLAEEELLDPGYSPDGDWPEAPALGLGFALRLVRNLAETVGGSLIIDPDRLALCLPVAAADA